MQIIVKANGKDIKKTFLIFLQSNNYVTTTVLIEVNF